MKVLVSAYACEPDAGSEPGAGWTWTRAAALDHEVWVMTRENNRDAIEAALEREPSLRMHPVYFDLPKWARWWKKGGRGVHLYYFLWQWQCRRVAKRLHAVENFDVAHHITFAVDWMPAGVIGIDGLPSVWGPVGGASPLPWRLRRHMGGVPFSKDIVRFVATGVFRTVFGRWAARKADIVVAQNKEVARAFHAASPVLEPNVAIPVPELCAEDAAVKREPDGHKRALFVGRVVAWKGVLLAIAALAEPEAAAWHLTVAGKGSDLERAKHLANDLGIADRVHFLGSVPRSEVDDLLRAADVFLFPSLHDSAPWAVGEAIAAGLPVVCLDVCGPSLLMSRAGGGVAVAPTKEATSLLAQALDQAAPSTRRDSVSWDRLPELLNSWYRRATAVPSRDP